MSFNWCLSNFSFFQQRHVVACSYHWSQQVFRSVCMFSVGDTRPCCAEASPAPKVFTFFFTASDAARPLPWCHFAYVGVQDVAEILLEDVRSRLRFPTEFNPQGVDAWSGRHPPTKTLPFSMVKSIWDAGSTHLLFELLIKLCVSGCLGLRSTGSLFPHFLHFGSLLSNRWRFHLSIHSVFSVSIWRYTAFRYTVPVLKKEVSQRLKGTSGLASVCGRACMNGAAYARYVRAYVYVGIQQFVNIMSRKSRQVGSTPRAVSTNHSQEREAAYVKSKQDKAAVA